MVTNEKAQKQKIKETAPQKPKLSVVPLNWKEVWYTNLEIRSDMTEILRRLKKERA
jgi:hypothetical protein